MSVTYGDIYGTLPTPTKSGSTFLGWFTSASGGTQVTSGTSVSTNANHTIYAHWGHTVTVSAGTGGKISPSTTTVTPGTNKTFTITPNDGYEITEVLVDGVAQTKQETVLTTKQHTLNSSLVSVSYSDSSVWND